MSQVSDILARLRRGETITPRDAYERHGCLALHSAAAEIRKLVAPEGLDVECKMIARGGRRWGEYRLVKVMDDQADLFGGTGNLPARRIVSVPQKAESPGEGALGTGLTAPASAERGGVDAPF